MKQTTCKSEENCIQRYFLIGFAVLHSHCILTVQYFAFTVCTFGMYLDSELNISKVERNVMPGRSWRQCQPCPLTT